MKKLNILLIFISLSAHISAQQNVFVDAEQNIFDLNESNVFDNKHSSEQESVNGSQGADGPGAPEAVSIEMGIPFLFSIAILGIIGISIYKERKNIKILNNKIK